MARQSKIDLCKTHLFKPITDLRESKLSEDDITAILRIREAYTFWRDFPSKREKEIRDHIMASHGVEKSCAYEDIKIIKFLLGNFEQASKDWHRWRFIQRNENTYQKAEKLNQAMAMARADADYAKYMKLDKEDEETFDWSTIRVQPFIPTSDPTVIGLKPIPNLQEKIKKLKEKYFNEIEAVDIDYIEDSFDPEDVFKTDKEREDENWQ